MHGSSSTAVGSSNPSSPSMPSLPRYSHIVAIDLGKFNSVLCRFDKERPASTAAPSAPLADRMGRLIRIKARPKTGLCEECPTFDRVHGGITDDVLWSGRQYSEASNAKGRSAGTIHSNGWFFCPSRNTRRSKRLEGGDRWYAGRRRQSQRTRFAAAALAYHMCQAPTAG